MSVVLFDVLRHPQQMAVMNVVWPVCALFGTGFVLWGYFKYGRLSSQQAAGKARGQHRRQPAKDAGFAVGVAKGALHGSVAIVG